MTNSPNPETPFSPDAPVDRQQMDIPVDGADGPPSRSASISHVLGKAIAKQTIAPANSMEDSQQCTVTAEDGHTIYDGPMNDDLFKLLSRGFPTH